MVGNYDVNVNVEFAKWSADSPDPIEQQRCQLEECYYDPASGNLVLTFEGRDTDEFFDVSVPIVAVNAWNEFANSLPRWDR
jgi:hypothetical protein